MILLVFFQIIQTTAFFDSQLLRTFMDVDSPNHEETSSSRLAQQRKKHRGNRSSQRFRRKCRARQIKSKKIEKLLKKRNQRIQNVSHSNGGRSILQSDVHTTATIGSNRQAMRASMRATVGRSTVITTTATKPAIRTNNRCKRKRDISIQDLPSHLSMTTALPPIKRIKSKKKMTKRTCSINPMIQMNYRYSIAH